MKSPWLLALVFCFGPAASAMSGDITGQSRGLDGTPVANLTVTVLNANNQVIARQFFADGAFSVFIQDNQLFASNQAITVLFSAPGRDTARLDNVLGTQVGQRIDIVLPLKLQAPGSDIACCRRRCRRCR